MASLEALGRRLGSLLNCPVAPSVARVEAGLTRLPFLSEETPAGPLFQRREVLAPGTCVGRAPVAAAARARSEVLALLALDPALHGISPQQALFFDTETTGLGGAGAVVFLFGALWFDEEGAPHLEQLLLRRLGEERPLLERIGELFARASMLVSFNGKAFDAPLLDARQVMNRLPAMPTRPHLDLLHVARRLHRARLGACRLTTLEREVLGFERGEDVDGSDIPGRYAHFLRSGEEEALRVVVEHNAWDVLSMAALVGLYGEPLTALDDQDLVGLARTYQRARALDAAAAVAEDAVARGVGDEALRVRGGIAKARGERAAALRDYAALCARIDDPRLRLELTKLYEHHARDPQRALAVAREGTGEVAEAAERRRARLERKVTRALAPAVSPRRRG